MDTDSHSDYEKELLSNLGLRIAFIRKERDINQGELGETSGKTLNTISNIERGVVDPKITTLSTIAHALKVPLPELLCFDPDGFVKNENAKIFIEIARILRRLDNRSLMIARDLLKSLHHASRHAKPESK